MSELITAGEPMVLFIADEKGPLSDVKRFTRHIAGAEVNVSVGVARLGHSVTFLTQVGEDPFGKTIIDFLTKEKIDTSNVLITSESTTGFMLKGRADNSNPEIFYYRKGSAASRLIKNSVDNIDFTGAKILHLGGILAGLSESTYETTLALIEKARKYGLLITFDPNLRPMLWENQKTMVETINDIASKCDLILPGLKEGKILTGSENPEEIADFYQKLGVEGVIVKLGDKGAYARVGSETFIHHGFKVENVVDTVGAGDGFACGIITGKLEGLSLRESVIRANAIGAIQVTSVSDNEGLPTREELKSFLESHSMKL